MLKLVENNQLRYSAWRVDGFQLYKYSRGEPPDTFHLNEWRRAVPKELRAQVLKENHDDPAGGHLGVYKTYYRIKQLYYWPRMKSDIAKYIRSCRTCLANKREQHAPARLMSSHPKVTQPWQMWSTDIVVPLPRSSSGYMFILVVCDYLSKFPLFFPLRKATAKAVTKIIEEHVLLFFGAPQYVLCDNGVQFRGREFRDMLAQYGSTAIYNPVYHPQANLAERTNRILKTMIRSYVKDDNRKLDVHLAKFACAIQTARHELTGFTPYYLNFGREFRPSGTLFGGVRTVRNIEAAPRVQPSLEPIFQQIKDKLKVAYQKNKKTYDLRRRPREFAPGDLVWRKNYVLSDAAGGIASKLAPKFLGPFKINARLDIAPMS